MIGGVFMLRTALWSRDNSAKPPWYTPSPLHHTTRPTQRHTPAATPPSQRSIAHPRSRGRQRTRPSSRLRSLSLSRSHPLFSLLQTNHLSLTLALRRHSRTHSRRTPPKSLKTLLLHSLKLRLGLRNTLSPVVSQSVASSTSTPLAATSPPPACFFLLLCAAQMQQQTQQQQMRIAQPTAIPTIRPILTAVQTLW